MIILIYQLLNYSYRLQSHNCGKMIHTIGMSIILASIFDNQAVQEITSLPIIPNAESDILRWVPSRDGKCTTKSIYRHLSRQELIQLPLQGSRSITHHANFILQKAWAKQGPTTTYKNIYLETNQKSTSRRRKGR
jgi:hypothetical protein